MSEEQLRHITVMPGEPESSVARPENRAEQDRLNREARHLCDAAIEYAASERMRFPEPAEPEQQCGVTPKP